MDHYNSSATLTPSIQLERRLERIEQSLDRVEGLFNQIIEQKDTMLGVAGDVLDGGETSSESRDQRMQGVAQLARELTEPQTTQVLSSALKVAPDLEGGLGMGLEVLDQAIREYPQLPEQLAGLLGLVERMGSPGTLKMIHAGLDALDQAPDLAGTMLDLADQQVRQWIERNQAQGSSVENVVSNAGQLIQWLSLDSTRDFLDKELSDSSSVQALAFLADSVRTATQRPPKAVGLLGGARKLGHSDSKYALGFVCDVVEQLGRNLSQRPSSHRPSLKQEN